MSDRLDTLLALHLTFCDKDAGLVESGCSIANHNVAIGSHCADFNGRDAYLEISGLRDLHFDAGEFSIAVQVSTDRIDDAIGDIVSKFKPENRRGFHLTVKSQAGAVTSQTNYRNLQFETDDGLVPQWYDYGRVGHAVAVWSLAVHEGRLFAGTYEQGADGSGRVYQYRGQDWQLCGPLDGSNTVSALATFDGGLYAATKTEDPHGSLLEPTTNDTPGGNVYRLNGDESWTHCGKVCDQDNIFGLTAYRGWLYAWPAYAKGVYRYDGGTIWRRIDSPDSRLLAMAPFHGHLYATANRLALLDPNATHAGPHGDPGVQAVVGNEGVFRLDPHGAWTGCGNQHSETQVYSIAIHNGRLLVGTWPSGKVFRYEGRRSWRDCGRLGDEDEVMGLAVYNGMLYAAALPTASIYRFDGDNQWLDIGCADDTPDVPLRRAINMAVYDGRLCVGTLPSGRVRAIEVGQVASHDWTLPSGWHSIVAVRRQRQLFLYLDGQKVAQSRSTLAQLDLNSEAPLLVGFGRHDYFKGRMRDLRVYRRALSQEEAAMLSPAPSPLVGTALSQTD